ncbi:MAG TPA: hypothetical protein VMS56_00540 [Thermoanaerobaculia bacterium]|nr:hypothetical protein [Thermoanaerobaculia bacterium]
MHRYDPELLPGVEGPRRRPAVEAADLRFDIESMRRRHAVEDLLDCALIVVIDLVFLLWAEARLPLLDRDGTLVILLAANALIVAGYVKTRLIPRWRARRIAATWSVEERSRFRQAA